jgi:hypothetical protein
VKRSDDLCPDSREQIDSNAPQPDLFQLHNLPQHAYASPPTIHRISASLSESYSMLMTIANRAAQERSGGQRLTARRHGARAAHPLIHTQRSPEPNWVMRTSLAQSAAQLHFDVPGHVGHDPATTAGHVRVD